MRHVYKKIFCVIIFLLTSAQIVWCQNELRGHMSDSFLTDLPGTRVTLFNANQSFFLETRTNATGIFVLTNIPAGDYFLGAASQGKAYLEQTISIPSDDVEIMLAPETHPGIWDVIMDSPEPLGGTDLGVLMPDGKIYYCHNTRDPFFFDPIVNDTISAKGSEKVQGCVGPIQTEDGKIWFIGGTLMEVYGPGTRRIKYYDPFSSSWVEQPDMLDYRWYPTVALLPSGNFLIAGGGNLNNPQRTNTSEIYNPVTGLSTLTGPLAIGNEISPIVVLYNGKALMTHRPPQLFDPDQNAWTPSGSFVQGPRMPNGDHSDCELVLMPDGEAIAIGYKSFIPGEVGTFIERYDPEKDSWSLGTSILPIRSRAKTCLLPDKKILVMGGYKEDNTNVPVNTYGYMKLTDLYHPLTDSWRRLSHLNFFREYHALAVLVPDGRVIIVGGEGAPGNEPPKSIIEAFSPPYLFRGVRPEIVNLQNASLARGDQIEFDILKTDSLTEVILMSNAVVTHFMNSGNNRYLSLPFHQVNGHVIATLPNDSIRLIPGYYILFAMVDDIPSIGKMIHVHPEALTQLIPVISEEVPFDISPNPVHDMIRLIFHDAVTRFELSIYDIRGKVIFESRNSSAIDVTGFATGTYFLGITIDGRLYTKSFIKL